MERRAAIVLLAAVIVASVAAFFGIALLERAGSPIGEPFVPSHFSPDGNGRHDLAIIKFQPREDGTISVRVTDDDGKLLRRLVSRRPVSEDEIVRLEWDGTTDDGRTVGEGAYALEVQLHEQQRTIRVPQRMHVDLKAPRMRVVRVDPDPRGCNTSLRVDLLTEHLVEIYGHGPTGAHLPVRRLTRCAAELDGEQVTVGRYVIGMRIPRELEADWPSGVETLSVTVVDRAGNASTAPLVEGARGEPGFQLARNAGYREAESGEVVESVEAGE